MSSIVIAGAGGFIGRHLVRAFEADGFTVRTIGRGRDADAQWGGDLTSALEGTAALINLAGRSVSCRYTKRTADEIFRSRTETTKDLGASLAKCSNPPAVWLNSSTGTIYRDARDRAQDEIHGELGSGFSVAVARAWEQELYAAPTPIRKVALRTAITLGSGGGALSPLINLARIGFGGAQGDGDQIVSWIHIDDIYGAIRHLIDHDIAGPVNLAAPQPVTNRELMAAVRTHFGSPLGLGDSARPRLGIPLGARMLGFGGRVIRTEPELVLKSRWVDPGVLRGTGYAFRFPDLDAALADIAAHTPRGLLPVQLG
ncbi:MAG: TIGR01777 family oxidoreductase [Actinobacteria bacterium]|nr:TIGR01777 family oxidoreductase [Actinomycetota bacterium]